MDHFQPDFPGKPDYRHLIPRNEHYSAGLSPYLSRRPQISPLNYRARTETPVEEVG